MGIVVCCDLLQMRNRIWGLLSVVICEGGGIIFGNCDLLGRKNYIWELLSVVICYRGVITFGDCCLLLFVTEELYLGIFICYDL